MNHAAGILALIGLAVGLDACLRAINSSSTNYGLPLVHASAPKRGFVCVPAITPHMGPVRTKELV